MEPAATPSRRCHHHREPRRYSLARATSLFSGRAYGIYAYANGPISVDNTGDITAIGNDEIVRGISVETRFGDSPVSIVNCGDIAASGGGDNFGIFATPRVNSPISIENSGDIASTTSVGRAYGMFAVGRSPISVANSGDIAVATSAANPGHSTANAVGLPPYVFWHRSGQRREQRRCPRRLRPRISGRNYREHRCRLRPRQCRE